METPLESRIRVGVGEQGEDVVTIPAAGLDGSRLSWLVLLVFFLPVFAVVAVGLVWLAAAADLPLGVRVFFAVVAGVFVMFAGLWLEALGFLLVAAFGEERLTFDARSVAHARRVFGLGRTKRYALNEIASFGRIIVGERHVMIARAAGGERMLLCIMRVGKRGVPVAPAVQGEGAAWLVGQLNGVLERHKGQ